MDGLGGDDEGARDDDDDEGMAALMRDSANMVGRRIAEKEAAGKELRYEDFFGPGSDEEEKGDEEDGDDDGGDGTGEHTLSALYVAVFGICKGNL